MQYHIQKLIESHPSTDFTDKDLYHMKRTHHRAILVAGLGYGDEGKGTIVDSLVRETGAHTVVRYNGGAQAAHNVVAPDGRHHTFSQFGAGTFVPDVRTVLSRYMLVNPIGMIIEDMKLREANVIDAFARTSIDERCLIITPFHVAANRIIEQVHGPVRNGSCGQGVGQTVSDSLVDGGRYAIRAGDLRDLKALELKLREIQLLKQKQLSTLQITARDVASIEEEFHILFGKRTVAEQMHWYESFMDAANVVGHEKLQSTLDSGTTVFEGAQGVLLDQDRGFFPHVTRSDTTFQNATSLLEEHSFRGEIIRIGVVRAYMTRHGAGPFVSEDSLLSKEIPDEHNRDHPWQQGFRVGWFDLVAMRYALSILGQIDYLAVTNVDRLASVSSPWKLCDSYSFECPEASNPGIYFESASATTENGIRKGIVTRIGVSSLGMRYMREVTRHIGYMKPRYRNVGHRDADWYVAELGALLDVPIGIASMGPKAVDKLYLPALADILHGQLAGVGA